MTISWNLWTRTSFAECGINRPRLNIVTVYDITTWPETLCLQLTWMNLDNCSKRVYWCNYRYSHIVVPLVRNIYCNYSIFLNSFLNIYASFLWFYLFLSRNEHICLIYLMNWINPRVCCKWKLCINRNLNSYNILCKLNLSFPAYPTLLLFLLSSFQVTEITSNIVKLMKSKYRSKGRCRRKFIGLREAAWAALAEREIVMKELQTFDLAHGTKFIFKND